MASSTLERIRATLRSALSEAVRQGLIDSNPATRVRLPKPARIRPAVWTTTRETAWREAGVRPAVAVWTRQHLATFLAFVKDDPLFTLWWLVALTGLRRGEVAALRWRDIDLDAATLTVHEQTVVVDGQDLLGPPKSARSRRTIALDKITVELLRELWRKHRKTFTATGRNRATRPAPRRRVAGPRRRRRPESRPRDARPLQHHHDRRRLHQRLLRSRIRRR